MSKSVIDIKNMPFIEVCSLLNKGVVTPVGELYLYEELDANKPDPVSVPLSRVITELMELAAANSGGFVVMFDHDDLIAYLKRNGVRIEGSNVELESLGRLMDQLMRGSKDDKG